MWYQDATVWSLIVAALLSLVIASEDTAGSVTRPEIILLELLSKPFAPTEAASEQCIKDSKIYFSELRKYNPWALQSKF